MRSVLWMSKIVNPSQANDRRVVAYVRLVKVSEGESFTLVLEVVGDYDLLGNPRWEHVRTFEPFRIPHYTSMTHTHNKTWEILENSAMDFLALMIVKSNADCEEPEINTGYEEVWCGGYTRVVRKGNKYRLERVYQYDAMDKPCWKECPLYDNNPATHWRSAARDFLKYVVSNLEKEDNKDIE